MDAFTPGMLVLGRYRIIATTAACWPGDAAVLARDELLGRFVDLRLSPAPTGTPLGDRFVQRVEGIALLRNPALPLVFDLAPIDDRVLLVSQHLKGMPPARYAGQPPWTLERALRLIERLATALGLAHAHGLCHGALRTDSIVLGPDDSPVFADFLWPAPLGLTGDEAPELRASAIPTPCSDVFALGRLLWYLLDPYPCVSAPRVNWREGFISRGKALPREARVLIARATETRPGDRYADGAALAAAIDGLLSSAMVTGMTTALPVIRQPTGTMPRVAVPPRRRAPRRLAVLTALAALIGAGAWTGTSAQGKTWVNASLLPASRQIAQTWSDLISGFTASPPAPVPVRVHRVIVSAEQRNRAVATETPLPATATPPGLSRHSAPPAIEPSLPTPAPAAPDPNPGLTPDQPNRGFWPDQPNRMFGPPWSGPRHGRHGWRDFGAGPDGATRPGREDDPPRFAPLPAGPGD